MSHPDKRIALEIPELVGELRDLPAANSVHTTAELPFVLSAGELTSLQWRDPLAGTPWHKHVPARVEALS